MRNAGPNRLLVTLILTVIGAFGISRVGSAQELAMQSVPMARAAGPGSIMHTAFDPGSAEVGSIPLLSPNSILHGCRSSTIGVSPVTGCLQPPAAMGTTSAPAARATFDTDMLLRQGVAAAGGGLAGALLLVLPVALAERGGEDVSSDVTSVLATIGYMGGSVVGVQFYSQRHGQTGSWWGTLGGAVLGGLGGPFFLLTVPTGAVLGFTLMPTSLLP